MARDVTEPILLRQRLWRTGIAKGSIVKTNATNDDYSYSLDPAKAMLDAAWAKLKSLYAALGLSPPP